MSRAVRIIVGLTLIIVGGYTKNPYLTNLGFSLLISGMTRPPQIPPFTVAQLRVNSTRGIEILPSLWGTVRVGGKNIVPVKTRDVDGDGSKEELYVGIAHGITHTGGIEGLEDLWIDGERIPDADIVLDLGIVHYVDLFKWKDASSNPMVYLQSYQGLDTQPYNGWLEAAYDGWTVNHKLKGIPYTVLKLIRPMGADNEKKFQKAFPNGKPSELNRLIKGNKCYDVRKDTTRGGSGLHRANDPSTWEWSDNPAVIAATYIVMDELDGGLGSDPDEDFTQDGWDTFAAAANVCDTTFLAPDTTTIKKYTANLAFASSEPEDNIDMLEACMAGVINFDVIAGTWKCHAGEYTAPTITIDESWVAGPISYTTKKQISDLYNAVKVNYVSASRDYREEVCKLMTDSSYETADGGNQIIIEIDCPGIDNEYRAQYRANIEKRRSREQKILSIPCNMKALQVGWWDMVTVDIPDISGTYRIKKYSFENGFPVLVMEQANSGTYDTGSESLNTPGADETVPTSTPRKPVLKPFKTIPDGILLEIEDEGQTAVSHYEYERAADSAGSPGASEVTRNFVEPAVIDDVSDSAPRHYRIRSYYANGEVGDWTNWTPITPNPASVGATKNQVFVQTGTPAGDNGDIWIHSTTKYIYGHNGSSFQIGNGADLATSVSNNQMVNISDSGALATKDNVDLSTGEVINKSLANVDATANTKLSGIETSATNNNIFVQTGTPAGDTGDIWIHSTNKYIYGHNGSSYQLGNGADLASSVTNNVMANISDAGALATENSADLITQVINKSLANLDGTANTKLSGIETSATNNNIFVQSTTPAGDTGDLWIHSTNRFFYGHNGSSYQAGYGANWSTYLANRPTELTDGRVPTALSSVGRLQSSLDATYISAGISVEKSSLQPVQTPQIQFEYDGTNYGPKRTGYMIYTYDNLATYTYSTQLWNESTIRFEEGGIVVATFTFRHVVYYGSETSSTNIALKIRSFWYAFASSYGAVVGDFTVDIGSNTGRSVWDGTIISSIYQRYLSANYGGNSAGYTIKVTHTATGKFIEIPAVVIAPSPGVAGVK